MLKLLDENWPLGIDPRWISKSEWHKIERLYLEGILNSKDGHHIAFTLNSTAKVEDLEFLPWREVFGRRQKCSAIIAYDILDHLPDFKCISDFLSACRGLLEEQGILYLMCHPGKSRVGTHLFKQNRAYLHLIRKSVAGRHTLMIDDPIPFYRDQISDSGFTVKLENIYTEPIETYFDPYSLEKDCEIQFVEYLCQVQPASTVSPVQLESIWAPVPQEAST